MAQMPHWYSWRSWILRCSGLDFGDLIWLTRCNLHFLSQTELTGRCSSHWLVRASLACQFANSAEHALFALHANAAALWVFPSGPDLGWSNCILNILNPNLILNPSPIVIGRRILRRRRIGTQFAPRTLPTSQPNIWYCFRVGSAWPPHVKLLALTRDPTYFRSKIPSRLEALRWDGFLDSQMFFYC